MPADESPHLVLIVEDDADIRESLAALLADEGYQVETACDGADAVRRLGEIPRPCLILLDLMMPRMNGWEFLKYRATQPALATIPVVIVSANVSPADVEDNGAVAAIRKPFELATVLREVGIRCHLGATPPG